MSFGPTELAAARSALTIAGQLGQSAVAAGSKATAALAAKGSETFAQVLAVGSDLASSAGGVLTNNSPTTLAASEPADLADDWFQQLRELIIQTLDRSGASLPPPVTVEFWSDGTVLIENAEGLTTSQTQQLCGLLASSPELQRHLAPRLGDADTPTIAVSL